MKNTRIMMTQPMGEGGREAQQGSSCVRACVRGGGARHGWVVWPSKSAHAPVLDATSCAELRML